MQIRPVTLAEAASLRFAQAAQLNGPVQEYTDMAIAEPDAICLGLEIAGSLQGYACFGSDRTLLEIYVEPGGRGLALPFLKAVLEQVRPAGWEINSYDRFGLSLAWNAGYSLTECTGYLFSYGGTGAAALPPGFTLAPASPGDLEAMRPILQEDNFYTVDWALLGPQVALGQWHLLREPAGSLVGIGYWEPLTRTPSYADVGMVVTAAWRRRGLGTAILTGVCGAALRAGKVPVSVCAFENEGSRRSLERAGFYADGRLWRVPSPR